MTSTALQTRTSFHPDDLTDADRETRRWDDLLLNIAAEANAAAWADPQLAPVLASARASVHMENQLELAGFSPDTGAPDFYTHSIQPCPSSLAPDPTSSIHENGYKPPIGVLNRPLSGLTNRFEKIPSGNPTLNDWLNAIATGTAAVRVAAVRAAYGKPEYDKQKEPLPCIIYSGTFPEGRAGKAPAQPSGLVFLEVDFHDGAPPDGWLVEEKVRLAANPAVAAVYVSVGGRGLHAVVAVDPAPADRKQYPMAWAWVTRELKLEQLGDPQVKDCTHLALISHDPAIYINPSPVPLHWEPNALAVAKMKRRKPAGTAAAFREVAARFGVDWSGETDEDCRGGLHMPCHYHGGDNPTALHVWLGSRELKDKKGNTSTVDALFAKCFTRDCDPDTVLRFLSRSAGFRWPLGVGTPAKQPTLDAMEDALAMLRLELRMNRASDGIEVRPFEGLEPDRILADCGLPYSTGWTPINETFEKALPLILKEYLSPDGGVKDLTDALVVHASASPHSGWPFREWLDSLPPWDGLERLDTLFSTALAAKPSKLSMAASKAFMVGVVRRALSPGAVHDWMPVLIGPQGLGKSRFCRDILPPEFQYSHFADDVDLSESKQRVAESIGGALIAEFSEMTGIRSTRATEGFKSFIVARMDRYRRPYAKVPTDNPRGWVGIGTSNGDAVPADETGSRRYAAIECLGERGDWDYVPANRNQIWAEALTAVRVWEDMAFPNPPPNLLPQELRGEQEQANSMHMGTDENFDDLAQRLDGLTANGAVATKATGMRMLKLWEVAHKNRMKGGGDVSFLDFGSKVPTLDKTSEQKFGAALIARGWRKLRFNSTPVWCRG